MSAEPNPSKLEEFIGEAKAMIFDLFKDAPLIDNTVWAKAVPNALIDLSKYKPMKKRFDLAVISGQELIDLPVDFVTLDQKDLNIRLEKYRCKIVLRDQVFALEWLTAASSSVLAYTSSSPFAKDSTLQVIDDGTGKRQLWLEPAPVGSVTIKTLYLARHQVTDTLNTLPEDLRELALQKTCYFACIALAVLVAGDKEICDKMKELAEHFNAEYEKSTRFVPFGMTG
jgi:hypothetical protein